MTNTTKTRAAPKYDQRPVASKMHRKISNQNKQYGALLSFSVLQMGHSIFRIICFD